MGGSTGNVMRTGSEVTVGSPTTPATTQDTTGSGSSPPHDHPITHPRPSATPTARLDACFPSIASFVMPSDPDPDSQTRLALSHLPPGLSLSTHTLHALLTDAARRAFAKSSANLVPQDTRATGRRMTLTAGNSNAPRRQSMMLLGPRRMSVMGDVNNPGGGGEAVGAPAAVVLPAAVTVWYDVALNMGPRGPPTPSAATAPVNVRTRSGAERERGKENVRPASGRSDTSGKGARPASARSDVSGKGFGPSGGTDVGIAITTTTTATITSDQDRSPRHRLDHTDPLLMYETYRVKTARGAGTSVGGGDKARGGSPPATGKATADAGPAAVQQPQPQPQPQPQTQAPALPPPSSGKGRKKAREGVPMVTFIEEGEGE
ncbi:uncharacterized protein EV422DRAFT_517774 [Fimicolochytrium jonesii]|uniref:uncharacterized protein n=1 Tax=Fimicolochytrium jonesii TaxID=1396493 RepID=UPI0022FE2B2D|nr:uncharacterized protein EV422DRAFT_517774 [Fimicolochytrium jonesii]KAI8825181.1 hypothetical protein EV422DRAFT_517774 [Fimicolochytrium jonesii]